MQFPESWLREFCNPPLDTHQLAEILTSAGLEVEEIKPVAPLFFNVVVGEIINVTQHPNADRLRVCQVDVGQEKILTIVCGASNARINIKVPCALIGAELPPGEDGKPFLIQLGKLRGIESEGMLCSSRELKLSEDHDGLLELSPSAPLGQDIRQHLQLDDAIFTLKLTPNLAHCLSIYGIAREVSALTGSPLKKLSIPVIEKDFSENLVVKVSAPDLCGRFSGRIIRGINSQAKTPSWMVERLMRCGQRSVTALVDISNYVMFELGHPSHIFDVDKIHGGLDVRWGKSGETLKLLNGNTIAVDEKVGVIADSVQIESLAGIMGGDATSVSNNTRNIYIEAAFWWPKAIAGRSRRFNFSTDAGHRFERGVDAQKTVECINRLTQLIIEICSTPETTCGNVDDLQLNLPKALPVTLRIARAAKVIGMPLTQAQCRDALQRLGLEVIDGDGTLSVLPPSYRFDLQIEEDLIEEVIRIVGYDKLPATPPLAPITAKISPEARRSPFAVRRLLASLGFQETINFSFVEQRWEHELAGNYNPIQLLNPISSQMSVMRSSLIGSLLQVLKLNLDRKAPRVCIFELGRVFLRDSEVQNTNTSVAGFNQPVHIAGLACGSRTAPNWSQAEKSVDFFDLKGDVEALFAPMKVDFLPVEHAALHPGRCAGVFLNGKKIGVVGELHPRWRQSYEINQTPVIFEIELEAVLQRNIPVSKSINKFQPVERDIAVIVKDCVTHAEFMAAIYNANQLGLLTSATLFDVYRPQSLNSDVQSGEKSLAVRLVLSSEIKTLNEKEIDAAVGVILMKLQEQFQARLRT